MSNPRRVAAVLAAALMLLLATALSGSAASADAHKSLSFGPRVCSSAGTCSRADVLHAYTKMRGGTGRDVNRMVGRVTVRNGAISHFRLDSDLLSPSGATLKRCHGHYKRGFLSSYTNDCAWSPAIVVPAGSKHCVTLWGGTPSHLQKAARVCTVIR